MERLLLVDPSEQFQRNVLMLLFGLLSIIAMIESRPPKAMEVSAECLVLAEVARSKFGFDRFVAPPLQPSGGYFPVCDWPAMRLKIAPGTSRRTQAKLVFRRPIIQSNRASVSVLVIQGKTSGGSYDCELSRSASRWRLKNCSRRIAL